MSAIPLILLCFYRRKLDHRLVHVLLPFRFIVARAISSELLGLLVAGSGKIPFTYVYQFTHFLLHIPREQ
jgi:hypothetical protein